MVDLNNRGTEFYEKIKNPSKKKLKWGFISKNKDSISQNI
jgi:hypothetical protein